MVTVTLTLRLNHIHLTTLTPESRESAVQSQHVLSGLTILCVGMTLLERVSTN